MQKWKKKPYLYFSFPKDEIGHFYFSVLFINGCKGYYRVRYLSKLYFKHKTNGNKK